MSSALNLVVPLHKDDAQNLTLFGQVWRDELRSERVDGERRSPFPQRVAVSATPYRLLRRQPYT